jgi:ribosomal protein S18 acetylase RimI-like enzyme
MGMIPQVESIDATLPAPSSRWSMRPAGSDHAKFCKELYVATRVNEVLSWGFLRAQAEAFLGAQAATRERAYAIQFPGAEDRILLADGQPAGRLLFHETDGVCRIVDIAVLPTLRNQGLGRWAIAQIIERAEKAQRIVSLNVERGNPARRLYERLGFRLSAPVDDSEPYVAMHRLPPMGR